MAEPPHKRSRRPDSKQMWDDADKRATTSIPERDAPHREPRRDERNRRDDRDRDRNRRYRSRSPNESWGGRGRDRDRDREGEKSGRGRDERSFRDGARPRDERDRRDRDKDGRSARDRPRERSRSRDRERQRGAKERSRSRSPRRERERDSKRDEDPKGSTLTEESTKRRTATPPVSFKVGGQNHDQMEVDAEIESTQGRHSSTRRRKAVGISDDGDVEVEDDTMAAMQAMMGFGGFGTTHQKKVAGNDISAVRKEKKTEYRQYMNRVGGFNRPLSPTRE